MKNTNSVGNPAVNNHSFSSPPGNRSDFDIVSRNGSSRKFWKKLVKFLALVLVAVIGFGTGVFVYFYRILGNVNYVYTPYVQPEKYEPLDLGELDSLNLEGDTQSSWADGGHTKVYVNPDFPIKNVAQKDKNIENILVFGVDSRGSHEVVCRADAIMIVSLDRNNKMIKITSLMRDCTVNIEGRSKPDKLGHSYAYGGVGLLINTINDNFGLDINRFVMLDFHSSSRIIDALGGVEIDVKSNEVKYANIVIKEHNHLFGEDVPYLTHEGYQTLSGTQAIGWARIRYSDSDFVRTSRQRTVASALMKKVSSMDTLGQLAIMEELAGMFETNMKSDDLTRLGFDGVSLSGQIVEYRVPADGMYTTQANPWMMILDWEKQIPALHEYIWGEAE